MRGTLWIGLVFLFGCAQLAFADRAPASLFDQGPVRGSLFASATPLLQPPSGGLLSAPRGNFFAPLTQRMPPLSGQAVPDLLDLIAKAEAGPDGYDAVQHGAVIRPGAPPTQMSIGEIYAWIDATPGQPHAIGRYQFIPPTLRRLVRDLDLPHTARFTPAVQDALADLLLQEAGIDRFYAGALSRHGFMNNLAKIWAGLPNDTGRSHYHGYAGNKATMTWGYFDAAMAQIFPG